MSDFVAEFGRKDHYYHHEAIPHYQSDGFVACFGNSPNSYHARHAPTEFPSPSSESYTSGLGITSRQFFPTPNVPSSPESCPSPMPPPSISSSCEGYSDEDVLDMISVKQLSKVAVRNVLESSFLQLTEKVLHGRAIDRIEGSLTIRLCGDSTPILIQLNRAYDDDRKTLSDSETEESVKLQGKCYEGGDSPRSVTSDEWMGTLSPDTCLRADARFISHSPSAQSPTALCPEGRDRAKSTDGSFDNSVPDLKSLLPVDAESEIVVKRNISDRSTQLESKREITFDIDAHHRDEEDVEDGAESPLVIDIPSDTAISTRESSEMDTTGTDTLSQRQDIAKKSFNLRDDSSDRDVSMESESEYIPCTSSSSDNFSDPDDSDESSRSSVKRAMLMREDTDSLEEAPGNSGHSRDLPVTPHSLASKMAEGIMCKCCRQILADPATLVSHAQEKHSLYCCNICFRTFTAKNNLKRHVRLHTGQRPFKCSQCHQKFARRDDLKGHMLRHDYSKPFRCNLCQKGYTDKACVKNHMTREHGSRRLIVCPQCGESFDNDEAFSTHKTSHPELRKFSCKDCPFIGTNKLMTMKHKLIHTHKLFSCKSCNAYFPDPFNYTSHVRTHKTQQAFRFYKCCFCDIILPSYEQFVRHEYSHAQGKTHSCSVCNKQFNSKASVHEHALSHVDAQENVKAVQDAQEEVPHVEENVASNNKDHSPSKAHTIPTIVLNEADTTVAPVEVSDNEVLDLSMKKSPQPTTQAPRVDMERQQPLSSEMSAVAGQLSGPIDYNAPRNGCVLSGLPAAEVAENVRGQSARDVTVSSLHLPVNKSFPTFVEVSEKMDIPSSQNARGSPSHPTLKRHGNHGTEGNNAEDASAKSSFLFSSLSKRQHGQTRYDPYKTSKMAEFAHKFFTARGSQPNFLGKDRQVLKSIFPAAAANEEKPSYKRGKLSSRAFAESNIHDNRMDAMRLKAPESEAIDNSQLPTFIKTETFFDTDPSPTVPSVDCRRSPSAHREDSPLRMSARTPTASEQAVQVCGQCKEEFRSFSELELHSVHAHKRYLCEYCGKSFSARPNRDRHVRYHTGERPFKCDLCDQAFFRGDDLKYHRTTRHPTAQPFVCTRCSASFTWKKDLERHIRQSKCKIDLQ